MGLVKGKRYLLHAPGWCFEEIRSSLAARREFNLINFAHPTIT